MDISPKLPEESGKSTISIPQHEWSKFLQSFGRYHQGWLVVMETHDLKTDETVVSHEMPLQLIEFDIEDLKHPRINISVMLDNKLIKHILFEPSQLLLTFSEHGATEALHVDSVNTATTVRFRPAIPSNHRSAAKSRFRLR
jgi:hypothetical protein